MCWCWFYKSLHGRYEVTIDSGFGLSIYPCRDTKQVWILVILCRGCMISSAIDSVQSKHTVWCHSNVATPAQYAVLTLTVTRGLLKQQHYGYSQLVLNYVWNLWACPLMQ